MTAQIRIDGETRLLGLIGEGISYTKSPALHNRAAAQLGINAVYLALPMAAADVRSFLNVAWRIGAVGFNVTTPHKSLVAAIAGEEGLTSVNTLYRGEDGWRAASTDGEGFARGLQRLGKGLEEFERLVVLGAGGATAAILSHAAEHAPKLAHVTVLRRAKGEDLGALMPAGIDFCLDDFGLGALQAALKGTGPETLLIQATSAPQRGDDLAELVPALAGFQGTLVDLVYGKPSALYFAALAQDITAQDGEAMLIEQARLSQRLWWGRSASYEEMAAALRGK